MVQIFLSVIYLSILLFHCMYIASIVVIFELYITKTLLAKNIWPEGFAREK